MVTKAKSLYINSVADQSESWPSFHIHHLDVLMNLSRFQYGLYERLICGWLLLLTRFFHPFLLLTDFLSNRNSQYKIWFYYYQNHLVLTTVLRKLGSFKNGSAINNMPGAKSIILQFSILILFKKGRYGNHYFKIRMIIIWQINSYSKNVVKMLFYTLFRA